MGEVEKNVKLRILRIQSVECLEIQIFWSLSFSDWHLLKLFSFFRLASVIVVFFFFSDWHLLKLFSVLRFVEQARNWPLRLRSTINHEWDFSTREFDHWRHFRTSGEIVALRDLLIKKPMHWWLRVKTYRILLSVRNSSSKSEWWWVYSLPTCCYFVGSE